MSIQRIQDYTLGDMKARYILDEQRQIAQLYLIPEGMEMLEWEKKYQRSESLIQLKLLGDIYTLGYSGGKSMRDSESTHRMKYDHQEITEQSDEVCIDTFCRDERGYKAVHSLTWKRGTWLESTVTFTNESKTDVTLEMLESFSLSGLTPFTEGDAHETLFLHRMRSDWSREGKLSCDMLEDLGLEPAWGRDHAVRAERFGSAGSMPVNGFFPYMLLEDRSNRVFWGAMLAHNAAWQMEVTRRDDGVSIGGGLADREFGHWMKKIEPGESFTTPTAILTVARDLDVDEISQRMTAYQRNAAENGPECEQSLPMMFNEYCTTWGDPSHANIAEIVKAITDRDFSYFVIDAGWYRKEGTPWDTSMGDYIPSKALFPQGLGATVKVINDAGMKAGLWFEMESVGKDADAYVLDEHMLKRDGQPLRIGSRKAWDLRQDWVVDYLSDRVIGTLRKYGFEYIKVDYNDTLGIGVDGAESLGEGMRQNMEASYHFFEKMKRDIPGLIVENCASGGHRLEPRMMGVTSMASFSDCHECVEIPVVAAALHRAIEPRQSQIWAVIHKTDSLKRIGYSLVNTLLGRMCISGDVTELSEAQWKVIDDGMSFYKETSHLIKNGLSRIEGTEQKAWRHLKGWQGVLREQGEEALVVLHTFETPIPEEVKIQWKSAEKVEILNAFSDTKEEVSVDGNGICWKPRENWKALALHLRKVK